MEGKDLEDLRFTSPVLLVHGDVGIAYHLDVFEAILGDHITCQTYVGECECAGIDDICADLDELVVEAVAEVDAEILALGSIGFRKGGLWKVGHTGSLAEASRDVVLCLFLLW